jgi:hypothetical protein
MKSAISYKRMQRYLKLVLRKIITDHCLKGIVWLYGKVSKCNKNACPLHPYRTAQDKHNLSQKDAAINEFCMICEVAYRDVKQCKERSLLWSFLSVPCMGEDIEEDYDDHILEDIDEETISKITKNLEKYILSPDDYVPPPFEFEMITSTDIPMDGCNEVKK